MAKWHVKKDGTYGRCTAKDNCPLGGKENGVEHFMNKADTIKASEAKLAKLHGEFPHKIKKTAAAAPQKAPNSPDYSNLSKFERGKAEITDVEKEMRGENPPKDRSVAYSGLKAIHKELAEVNPKNPQQLINKYYNLKERGLKLRNYTDEEHYHASSGSWVALDEVSMYTQITPMNYDGYEQQAHEFQERVNVDLKLIKRTTNPKVKEELLEGLKVYNQAAEDFRNLAKLS